MKGVSIELTTMQYSVRTRRRLRPQTRDVAGARATGTSEATVVEVVEAPLANGTGAIRQPLITQPVIERVSPRAMATSWRR